MKEDFITLLKWSAGLGLGASAVAGYQYYFPVEWPRWVGIFIVLAMASVGIGFLFFRRLWVRGKEHRRSAQEEARRAAEPREDRTSLKALGSQWNQAIGFLRRSHLKKRGNPLYVLPWYMVIGESGSGKTAAISGARLSSFAEEREKPGLSETKNCDWSFFEQAIVIDTAGRYLSPVHEERDREEWQRLLDLLFKYRKKEPLNGLVVAVSAEKLLGPSSEALENAGQNARKRIDELMKTLGARFPVYVLVTKCDLVRGMAGFCDYLSESGRNQPMGCLNQNAAGSAAAFVDTAFDAVRDRLMRLRLVIARRPDSKEIDPDSFIFPDAFPKLQKGLAAYIRGAFQENVYQETPLLRGLFFSSGRAVVERLAPPPAESLKGYFLHEFFSKVLPADRSMFVATKRAMDWRKGTMNLGLATFLILATAIGGLMTYSFAVNLTLLRDADRAFSHLPPLQGNLGADILAMDRLNQAILSLTEGRRGGWLYVFGLHEVGRVKQALKEKLSAQFRGELLAPVDDQNAKAMAAWNAFSPDFPFSQSIEHLIGRIKLIRARLGGDTLESGDNKQPPAVPFLQVAGRQAAPETRQKFAGLYLSYVFWLPDAAKLSQEMLSLQALLKRLLTLKAGAPHWVIAWAKSQESGNPVTFREYWGGDSSSASEPSVSAIFSRKDKSLVDSFFKEIEVALDDPAAYRDLKSQFEQWYRANAFGAWRGFVIGFPQGSRRLRNREEWRQAAARMPKDDGPYFALLNNIAQDLEPLAGKDLPPWLREIFQIQALKGPQAPAAPSRWGQRKSAADSDPGARTAAAEALANYRKALEKAAETVADPSQIMQATAQAFQEGSGPGASPFAAAFNALSKLKAAMAQDGPLDPAVSALLSGPVDFLWEYARRETGDRLQTEWEQRVLAEASGIAHNEAASAVLNQDGAAIRFAKDEAAPFLEWKPGRGYGVKTAFGATVPFTGAFFSFVNSGKKVSIASRLNSASVTITALAPETNAGSHRVPDSARLELDCSGIRQTLTVQRQRLIDRSFNIAEKTFAWSQACSDVTLEIDVGSSRLIKRYPGPHGFFAFLKVFKSGAYTFTPADFPADAGALSQMGIDAITLPYRFKGVPEEVPDFTAPDPIPARIVRSWGG